MTVGRGWIGFLLLTGMAGAQVTPGRVRKPPSDTPVTEACPAAGSVPVAVSYSATSSDYVELRRTDCVGGCPAYTVRVNGDGRVSWIGERNVVVAGAVLGSVDAIGAKALIQEIMSRGFWGLCGVYRKGGAEMPSYVTTVQVGGQVRRVEDRGNVAPGWLRTVNAEIDDLTDSHRWRHGESNDETFGGDRAGVDAEWPKRGVTRLMKVAARGRSGELREMLADTSLDLNAVDSSGWTAVMYAAQAGPLESLTLLIADRADVLRRSYAGESAMSAAVSSRTDPDPEEKVRALWTAGLNINAADRRGVTPLMLAARRGDRPALVAAMMKLGADPTKRDVEGKNAVNYLKDAVSQDATLLVFYQPIVRLLQVPGVR